MSTDVSSAGDAGAAKQLLAVTLLWLVLVLGAGVLLVFFIP